MSGGIPKRVYHAFPTGGQTGGRITDLWVRKQRKRHQLKSYNEWLHPLASDGDGGLRPRIIMKKSEQQVIGQQVESGSSKQWVVWELAVTGRQAGFSDCTSQRSVTTATAVCSGGC
jgi:hypothetical protein